MASIPSEFLMVVAWEQVGYRPAPLPSLGRGTRAFPEHLPACTKRSAGRSHNRGFVHSAALRPDRAA